MTERPLNCLVTGATGYVGGRLIPRLLAAGHQVRAMARNPQDLQHMPWVDDVEVVAGDLTDPESLPTAFDDVDVVYYLVHSMGSSPDFSSAEAESANHTVDAARRAHVGRLVYLGGLHPRTGELSTHLRSRTTVGDTLIDSGIDTVVLQAGVVIGAGSASFEMIRLLAVALPVLPVPTWTNHLVQPIAVDDVLYYLTAAATADIPRSRSWDIGGPNVLRYRDMLGDFAEEAGLPRRRFVPIPFVNPSLSTRGIAFLTPMPVDLVRPLVESLRHDAVMKDRDIDTIISPPPSGLGTYRKSVREALRPPSTSDDDGVAGGSNAAALLVTDPSWAHHGRQ
ncbi:NAD-dependent epimerase/dehydratase family protein [Mycolicibacterium sp. P1-18]|uniref:NAD(P)H-binding protein n=1 Tax=Mycolicibacterium sp. P1-18 TaxID=2024615 RepID=UPI0011F28A2D|nr:NAD(P)H-binding protein [Mycolicibacterium sp. P1-18]KAA0096213.1 NAD-dependent epimerase/dehydratase family protein [Mycolicibacterium sp. P1-18]